MTVGDTAPSDSHDVHIIVTATNSGVSHFGRTLAVGTELARVFLFDELQHECNLNAPAYGDCDANHSRPNTWWYAAVMLNDATHTGDYGTAYQREASVSHELGHAIGLGHDGNGDGLCGTSTIPITVMDYDCLNLEATNSPTFWDICGVNHAYYDPNWGYAGCAESVP